MTQFYLYIERRYRTPPQTLSRTPVSELASNANGTFVLSYLQRLCQPSNTPAQRQPDLVTSYRLGSISHSLPVPRTFPSTTWLPRSVDLHSFTRASKTAKPAERFPIHSPRYLRATLALPQPKLCCSSHEHDSTLQLFVACFIRAQ